MNPLSNLVREIRRLRTERGWTQRDLAARAGRTQGHISRIESGRDLNVSTLVEIAALLGAEVVLVPRPLVGAVRDLIDGDDGAHDAHIARLVVPDEP